MSRYFHTGKFAGWRAIIAAIAAVLLLNGCYYAYETRAVARRSWETSRQVTSEVMDEQITRADGTVEHRTVNVFSETVNGKLVGRRVLVNGVPAENAQAYKWNYQTHSYERVTFTAFGTDALQAYGASQPENWLRKGYAQGQPLVRELDRPLPAPRAAAAPDAAPQPIIPPALPQPDMRRPDAPLTPTPGGGTYKVP